jgi:dynein heavy chain
MTYAVKLGSIVLIEDIGEEISPAIDAILLR